MTWLRAGWAVVLLAVAAFPLSAGWSGSGPWSLFAGAVVVAFGVVVQARRFRLTTGMTLVGAGAAALIGGYFVARGAIAGGPVEVLRDSVPRLLTSARPAPPTPDLLMPGVLLVFLVALVVAVSVAGEGRSLIGPPVGAVVLYAAGALVTAGRADGRGLVAVGVVALAAFGWVVVDRAESTRRVSLGPPGAVLAVLAAAALLAGVLPNRNAFEPRELVRPPVTDIAVSNPLPQLASWAAMADTELLRMRGPELPVRLVVLADYTGAAWQASSLYGPIGAVAPPDLPAGRRAHQADVELVVGALDGNWLPTVGRPVSTSLGDVMVDPDSGSLMLPRGMGPGLSYDVRGVVDRPNDDDLATAKVPTGDAIRRYLDLPGLPATLADYARQAVLNTSTPYEQAVALEQVVRLDRHPDAEAPVGSSYARIEQFLYGPLGDAGAAKGTAEQFATAFAVLGRAVGLPTRVVVGFQPVPEGPDGYRVIRGVDATAWPEVYFADWGWVPFDPVSGTDSGPSAASKREVLNRLASTTAQPTVPAKDGPPLVLPPEQAKSDAAQAKPQARHWLLLFPALPLSVLLVLACLRGARHSRLRRAGALGAWASVLDLLLLARRQPARHLTAPDIAALAPDSEQALRLAALADRAAFAPDQAGPDDSWRLAGQVRAGIRRLVPWYRRLFWAVDPRPLRRRW
ncbi:transglutaminase family protein [Actinokineospora xionganensis]|uniref:Transglutaminase domain-containing protein n=1 Tax=Actinokineospora xionganensis TaxID=2684470 RepID=A0ABR7LAJ4_9PSEU|nr:transglutaminase domain-containing protein [Actinokineospora xionganensis]MBC6449592.1 transglutaminase domain-containing protein [Actinokineospora xionganensis]